MSRPKTLAGLVASLALLACMTLAPAAARGAAHIEAFSATPSTTQAGGHPDVTYKFTVSNRITDPQFKHCACNDFRDAIVNLPPGLIGNPHATPRCTALEFSTEDCPVDSQVGTAEVGVTYLGGETNPFFAPLYNLVPQPDQAALLGFRVFPLGPVTVYTSLTARTGSDYGVRAVAIGANHLLPVREFKQVLWGVPASPANDDERYFSEEGATGAPSSSPEVPFMSNPTTCGGGDLVNTLEVVAYDLEHTYAESTWPATTGCDQLSFNPSLSASPTTSQADAPSGIDVRLSVPQQESPTVPSPSEIRAVTTTLPVGFSINPSAADGKTSCSDAQGSFGTENAAQCPEFSKVGTLEIDSNALPGPIPGFVYLGDPKPGDRYRIILVADGYATHVKLAGSALIDKQTGQITVSFQNLPQSPLTEFNMHFFGSERGVLATPTRCGTYPIKSTFTPWNSFLPDQSSTQFFTITQGPAGAPCPGAQRPFDPSFKAASQGNTAGAFSPFAVDLQRADGDQNISGLTVSTPPGFSGVLKGIPYCSEAAIAQLQSSTYTGVFEQASPACPAASYLGKAIAGAGAGSRPFHAPGKVYLAGPYKGAPLSLVVVIPAVSGPYDLGNVAVRAAIYVNPTTARVTTVSDPLPQILEGIPLRTRSIRVELDRPKFAINPTNCSPLFTEATVSGAEGATDTESSHYQVANCANLGFEPELRIKLKGGTKRGQNPALRATLKPTPGDANIAGATVTLPHSAFLDNSHIKTICTRPQFQADQCPAGSVYGKAKATSPLIDGALEGPVYLRANGGERLLPDLVAKLDGQIDFEVVGYVDAVNQQLRTTFAGVPDVPVSSFTVSMLGGSKGLIENSENLCAKAARAKARFSGQNGKAIVLRPKMENDCGGKKAQRKRRADAKRKGVDR